MSENALPPELLSFIRKHIHSVEAAEILLLLLGNPDREWDAGSVSAEPRSSSTSAEKWLVQFAAAGLVSATPDTHPRYKYKPATPELDALAKCLREHYSIRRLRVLNEIVEAMSYRADRKLLNFARSFRFGKGEDDG